MKKKFLGRVLTMLLVASMVFTLLPASAIAAGNWWWNADEYTEEAAPTATADNYSRILHLDCGRKYFSKDWIIALLHEMQDAGYNQLQLAFGNDGLRFLLKDMTFVANETTYNHATIVQKVEAGNELQNSSGDKSWLNETEMNEIIAAAKSLGIEIIPLLNLPGHANAILDIADDTLNASGSNNTLDVANSEAARNFGMAIFEKYLKYFNEKGCRYFCFGADEYANDASGTFSFSRLDSTQYRAFVSFINDLAGMIIEKGMTPRAFNDGLYYNGQKIDQSTYQNIQKIQCCYWSSGWGDYPVAPASTIAQKGHKMINTHGDWYYVTKYNKYGQEEIQIPSDSAIRGFSNTAFSGSTINNPVGSMFCIWCDAPAIRTEQEIAGNIRLLLRKMAARMQDKSIDTINTGIVTGGFNEDGSLNTTPVQPDTGITITPEGGTTGKLDSAKNESIVLDAGKVVTWSYDPALVTLTNADASSEVALADFATLRAQRVTVTPVEGASGNATITAKDDDGHSDDFPIEVVNSSATTGVPVELKVGDTSKPYTVEGDVTGQVDETGYDSKVATYQATPRTETTPGGVEPLKEPAGKEFYIRDEAGTQFLNEKASWVNSIDSAAKWKYQRIEGSDEFYLVQVGSSPALYIRYSNWYSDWRTTTSTSGIYARSKFSYDGSYFSYSTVTLGTPVVKNAPTTTTYTDITFHGVGEGDTSVTIGGTLYTIKVSYYEQPVNVVLNQSTEVAVSGKLNKKELDESVATVSISTDGTTMTVKGVAEGNTSVIVGNTRYNITVSTENLETVPPLKIEYWITNKSIAIDGAESETRKKVLKDEEYPVYYQNILAAAANSEKGVMIDTYAPSPATVSKTKYVYWLSRILDTKKPNTTGSGTEAQTADNGDDETQSGSAFTKIRYHQSKWSVFTENNEWVEVDAKHQLVAYYMQLTEVTNEVTTTVVDWGVSPATSLGWDQNKFGLVDFAVKYEDGQQFPTTFPTEKTVAYAGVESTKAIGQIRVVESAEYEVYMITLTRSSDNATDKVASNITYLSSYEYKGAEKVVWVDDESNLGSFDKHENYRAGGDATIPSLTLVNCQGVLVTYYLRTKVTEDSLTVNYVNQTTVDQFYSYNIAVASGKTFKPTIRLDNPAERNLLDGDVVNIKGVTQNVTADLIKMPGVPAQYRYSKYQCKELVKNDDKTITLYYTFNNSVGFVVDFGLPLTITPKDVNEKLALSGVTIESVKVENVTYGTCSIDGTNFTFTYTPGKDFVSSGSGEALTVKYTGRIYNEETHQIQQSTVSYQVYIYPASNVLYEASFLTQVSEDNGPAWTPTHAATKTQQTQKVGDTTTKYSVFGHDEAYDNAYGALGAWTATGLKAGNGMTKALTTNFYGNGFDLIGKCGPKTGSVVALIKNTETNKGKFIDVDTRYQNGDIYQVPLLHVTLAEGPYTVTIYGGGLEATNETPASYSLRGAATYASDYSVDSHNADLYSILAENGLTMADVEYVKVDSAPAAAKTARRATSFYALDTAAETGPVTHEAGDHVEIDGFRVYRSTNNTNNTNYPEGEKNVQYLNILDAVSSFTAFVEGSGSDIGWTARKDYENAGGPQNEIYLRKTNGENSAIAFKIDPNAIVQISARAVENGKLAKLVVNGTETVIATNTEMYYTVKANERGIVTIKNTGEGMLALGNLKIKNGTQAAALSEEDYPAAIALLSLNAAPETPDTVFEPTISAKVTTTKFIRSKVVTLTVSASADVAKLTVNGTELRPTNGWLVSMGWSKSYNYILTETVKKSETRTYEIIGYSADGTASTPTVVKSK